MNKKNFLLPGLLASSMAVFSSLAFADAQEEVNKQIAKLISGAITERIGSSLVSTPTTAKRTGVEDPNNLWGSYTNTAVSFSGAGATTGLSTTSNTGIFLAGYDRDLGGGWMAGASATSFTMSTYNYRGWRVSPYAAYNFSDSLFAKATTSLGHGETGYSTTTSRFSAQSDMYGLGLALGTIHKWDAYVLKGEAGVDASHTKMSTISTTVPGGVTTNRSIENGGSIWKLDGEASRTFGAGYNAFAGATWSRSKGANQPYSIHARAGLDKEIAKGSRVTFTYDTKVADNVSGGTKIKIDNYTISANYRF